MSDGVAWDQHSVRQRALVLLSVADSVNSEGWSDAVAAVLRRAANDLLGMVSDPTNAVGPKEVAPAR